MKKQITTVLAATALIAMAGAANASTDINLYGASAQYKFWSGAAGGFMTATVANGGLGCTGTSSTEYNNGTTDPDTKKNFIIQGTGCDTTVVDSDGVFNFRVSSKASYDGIFAVLNSSNAMASNECGGDMSKRKMAVLGSATTLACQTITHGASDVPTSAFVQSSSGQIRGHLGGGSISRSFSGDATFPGASSLTKYQPVKIPFGFYVSNTVTAKTCTSASPSNLVGEYCASDVDCGGASGSCSTTPTAISNMTREMATQIYAGNVVNWQSFTGFTANPVVLCMRHAGSGTHATLDTAVMNKSWGRALPTAEVSSTSVSKPVMIWFNDSSDDAKACMTAYAGSAGYLDADSSAPSGALRLKYNGQFATASNIAKGVYDFYSDLSIYEKSGLDTKTTGVAGKLLGVGGWLNQADGTNSRMTAANRVFIATDKMMKVKRANFNPFTYPSRIGQ